MRAYLLKVIMVLAIAVVAIGTTFASAGFIGAADRSLLATKIFGTLSAFPANGGTDASLSGDRVDDLQRALRHTVR